MYGSMAWDSCGAKQSLIKRNTLAYKRVDSSHNTPSYIENLLIRNSDIHQRETRYSNLNLLCPKYSRKTEGGRTFAVRTITEWNSIDSSSRNKGSVASFKRGLYKKYLTDQKATTLLK